MSHHLHEFWKARAFWKAKTTILKSNSVAMCQKCHQNNENHRRKTVNIGNAALAPQTDQEIRIFPIPKTNIPGILVFGIPVVEDPWWGVAGG